jgi:sulfite oxidase
LVVAGVGSGTLLQLHDHENWEADPKPEPTIESPNAAHQFRVSEISKHDRHATEKWVVCGAKVYNITDFIEAHPGGEVILRACGGSIDPYWDIFTIHKKPEVKEILDQYEIGSVSPADLDADGLVDWSSLGIENHVQDPFSQDPIRDERLIVHTAKPCNAETPADLLTSFITPIKHFFVRNHLWVPQIDPDRHSVTFEFADGEESTVSLSDMKANFEPCTVTATLQCSGNRRKHMSRSANGKTSGLQWDIGAMSTANFTGVRLCDVLKEAGYEDSKTETDQHIHFTAPGDTYSVSIPLSQALSPTSDVLLAWEMNGEALTPDHGGPLRALVPGFTAARSVKWLGRITISDEESTGQYQRRDYKCFPSHIKSASEVCADDWDKLQSIQETPVQSAITSISKKADKTHLKGFAFSGGGRAITRIDVSNDGGKSWEQAEIQDDEAKGSKRWAWTLWTKTFPNPCSSNAPDSKTEYVVRAVDDSYNTQPENFDCIWNFRGLLANAWHRLTV